MEITIIPCKHQIKPLLALTLGFWAVSISSAFCASPPNQATAADLNSVLKNASAGQTIETGARDFGTVSLANYHFSSPVTLKFPASATVERLRLENVTGLTFEGIKVVAGQTTNPGHNAVLVNGGGDITFKNSQFQWSDDDNHQNDGTAVSFDKVIGITIINAHFSHSRNGVMIRSSENVAIQNSMFSSIQKDGIVVSGTTDMIIDKNTCLDFTIMPGQDLHPDCIQLQAGGRAVGNKNITISNNKAIRRNGGRFQGIFVKSRFADAPHIGITIEGNYVEQSMGLGIAAINTRDLIIRGNEVRPANTTEEAPRILVRFPSVNATVVNNIASGVKAPINTTIAGNTILQ